MADSRVTDVSRNPDGSAFVVSLELAGHAVTLMNGGPDHPLTDAASVQVVVDTQDEVDRLWAALTDGGTPGPCGWPTDRYGLSWQVVPAPLLTMMSGDRAAAVGAAHDVRDRSEGVAGRLRPGLTIPGATRGRSRSLARLRCVTRSNRSAR